MIVDNNSTFRELQRCYRMETMLDTRNAANSHKILLKKCMFYKIYIKSINSCYVCLIPVVSQVSVIK